MSLAPREAPSRTSAALRWTMAGLLVVGVHGGAGWWVVTHPFAQAAPPDTVQGIAIDLEPVAAQQNVPAPNATMASGAAPTPQAAAAPDPQSDPQPTPAPMPAPPDTTAPPPPDPLPPPPDPVPSLPDPPPPDPASPPDPAPPVPQPPPVVEPKPELLPVPVPAPETPPMPPPPVESKTDAVLAPAWPPSSPPRPRPPKPLPPRPDPRTVALDAARRRALADRRDAERAERAAARAQAAQGAAEPQARGGRSNEATAPSSASSGASVSAWRGEVVAHLNAYKPASPNGASGTARVAFSVDRGGRVLSASLAGSSGDAALDVAAVAMVRRASPVPAPPPELGGRVSLAVPVWFH